MFQQSSYGGFDGASLAFNAGYAAAVDLDPDTILSPADVARAWGLTPAAVRNMIIAGDLPAEQDERGYYEIRAEELSRRPVVVEVTPAAQLGKLPADLADELRRLHARAEELARQTDEAWAARNAYLAELANEPRYNEAELSEFARDERYDADDIARLRTLRKYSPMDIGRQLPGEGAAQHMSRSTVNRLAKEHRDG